MGRLFLDSNVLVKGFVVSESFDRVVLKYCAARLHQMVYAEAVKIEVERFLLNYAVSHNADWLLEERQIRQTGPAGASTLSRRE
jgi:hypothetical protein